MTSLDAHRDLAAGAVRRAAEVCEAVRRDLVRADTLEKTDRSPVTVADFASQAVVSQWLLSAGGDEPLVAEESADALRQGAHHGLRDQVVRRVGWALGTTTGEEGVLDWIDRGSADPPPDGTFWTLDPIDGTKGFLRDDQYAVALARIDRGRPVVAALACPRLRLPGAKGEGTLLVAVRGQGTWIYGLGRSAGEGIRARVAGVEDGSRLRFTESVESGHSRQGDAARIAARVGIEQPPLRLDSQAKYAVLAGGEASVYLRLPTRRDYEEKIWDHAAGCLVVEEAGGRVTDVLGAELDFSRGRTLAANRGVVASHGPLHDALLEAIRALGADRPPSA
jgi:3'(2'), 5'-bisphosphate nucleotidase